MKVKRTLFMCLFVLFVMSVNIMAFAHSGRTDSSGGHRDNKNKSGLGYYHYHCGGYPPHLHSGGVCPYKSGTTTTTTTPKVYSTPKPVYATKVNVTNMPSIIKIGEGVKLNASAYPSNAEDKTISWESSDTSVATVDSSGNLVTVGVGTVTISAKTSRGTTTKYDLTVEAIEAESVAIKGKVEEIVIGKTTTLSVLFSPENTTFKDVEWKSSNENVVSVEDGELVAVAVGKATVTATHNELADSFEIEVLPILAESVEICAINGETGKKYDELKFKVGDELKLQVKILPVDTTDPAVQWSVDNTELAKINQDGVVTMLSEGRVTVTAKTSNEIVDEIEIEINRKLNVISILILIVLSVGTVVIIIVILVRKKRKK